jgi:hypothetical protein
MEKETISPSVPKGGRPGNPIAYSHVSYNGMEYTVMKIQHHDKYIKAVIDKEDFSKIKDSNWHFTANSYISHTHIIHYEYLTTCETSFDAELHTFQVPTTLTNEAPFDIILIDGPEGYRKDKPGRLLPCYWATLLSKPGTIVYIDDSSRELEKYCIQKFFGNKVKEIFPEREECTKLYM